MPNIKNWQDIQRLALHDPIVQMGVTLVELNAATKEEALTQMVVALVQAKSAEPAARTTETTTIRFWPGNR